MKGGKPYDVIILGAGFSGLLAAALLAKRGRHVLVLEEEATPGGLSHREARETFSYIKGPALFLGFERDGLYDRLFVELGLSLSMLKKEGTLFLRSIPPFQTVLPQHRINFYVDPNELLGELSREFPDHIQGFRALSLEIGRWDEILRPAYHLVKRRSLRGFGEWVDHFRERVRLKAAVRIPRRKKALAFLEPFGLDSEFCRGLELALLLFMGRTLKEATGLDLLLLLGLLRREVVAISGGIPRLAELLVKVIQDHQGEVIFSQPLEALIIEGRRLTAIRTKEGEVSVAGSVIANIPFLRLPQAGSERRFLSLYFAIAADALPSAMSEHLLMTRSLPEPPFADNFLFLILSGLKDSEAAPRGQPLTRCSDQKQTPGLSWAVPSPQDLPVAGQRVKGQRALQVITSLSESREPTPAELERLRDSILAQLIDLMPFSRPSLTFLGYDLWTAGEDNRLSAVGASLLSRAKDRSRNGATYYTMPIRNLFLLPDQGHRPAWDLGQARSALELAEHLLELGRTEGMLGFRYRRRS